MAIYKALLHSSFLNFFQIDIPFWHSKTDDILFAKMLERLADKSTEIFGSEKLFLIVFPEHSRAYLQIKPFLNLSKIEIINLTEIDLNLITDQFAYFQVDHHPTSAAYDILSQLILKELQKRGYAGTF